MSRTLAKRIAEVHGLEPCAHVVTHSHYNSRIATQHVYPVSGRSSAPLRYATEKVSMIDKY
jgi:hypothetical protein